MIPMISESLIGPLVFGLIENQELIISLSEIGVAFLIFTAGSGGHTGPEKTIDIDQNAAIRSIDMAKNKAVKRYIMVSAQGVREPELPSKIQHYYKAKRKADDYLISSGLEYTQ